MRLAVAIPLVVLTFSILAGCSGSSGPTVAVQTVNVKINAAGFYPVEVFIHVGSSVAWKNTDTVVHTVTADAGAFDSGNLASGGSFTQTFQNAGTFAYHCKVHARMTGTVTVSA
ncbi:MAG: cupredoxin domain-containing protein [bacterium]